MFLQTEAQITKLSFLNIVPNLLNWLIWNARKELKWTCISPCPLCCPLKWWEPQAAGLWCTVSQPLCTADTLRNWVCCRCCRRWEMHWPRLSSVHSLLVHPGEKESKIAGYKSRFLELLLHYRAIKYNKNLMTGKKHFRIKYHISILLLYWSVLCIIFIPC